MRIRHSLKAAVLTAAFSMAAVFQSAFGGTFQVTPVRVELSAQQATAALTVSNNGTEPVVVQLQSSAWAQDAGNDQYSDTNDLIASPPIFTILPGAEQIVRVGLRRRPDASAELSYRLYLQEVPAAPAPGFRGLQMALRIGIPVFVEATSKSGPELRWTVEKAAAGQLKVVLHNAGKAHIQVTDFKVTVPGSAQALALQQVSFYLLPAQQRSWILPLNPAVTLGARTLHVTAFTDAGTLEADVPLGTP